MHQWTATTSRPLPSPTRPRTPQPSPVAAAREFFKAIKDKELTARKDGKATLLEADELRRWVRSLPTIGRQSAAA